MSKPFDNTTKFLLAIEPESWPRFLGIHADKVELRNTDLSTVSSNADCLLLLDNREALHVENQASYDSAMGERVLLYNILSRKALNVPVRSFVILLRPEADGPAMNGLLKLNHYDGSNCIDFQFNVVRVWEHSADEFFNAGLGLMPLAFVSDIKTEDLPGLVLRAERRLKSDSDIGQSSEIWTAIDILLGLRWSDEIAAGLLTGVRTMKESTTYQAILREGEALGEIIGARKLILRNCTRRFGPPDAKTLAALEAINSLDKFDDLNQRSLIVASWDELLAG